MIVIGTDVVERYFVARGRMFVAAGHFALGHEVGVAC